MADSTTLQPNREQKGLEKAVGNINTYVLKVETKISETLFGAYALQGKPGNGLNKALDRGIIKLLEELSSINICAIFNSLANNKLGKSFNPSDPKPRPEEPVLTKVKYEVQMNAFKLQSLIDAYYAGGVSVTELVRSVNLSINALLSPDIGLNNPDIRKQFPEVDLISNFLRDRLGDFSSDVSGNAAIPQNRVQSILDSINKIRSFCVAIQALNNPAAIVGSIPSLQDQLNKLNQLVKPEKLVPLLKRTLKTCKAANSTCRSVLGYISKAQTIIRIIKAILQALRAVQTFLLANPAPSIYTTLGISTTLSNKLQKVVQGKGINQLLAVVKQISNVLDTAYSLVTVLVAGLNGILKSLNILLLNIQSCRRDVDPNGDVEKEVIDTIKEIEQTRNDLQKFIDTVNQGKERIDNTFGGYTIQIITEQLADEGIVLKRRYGVALDKNGTIVVQSTPTFASLDQIIINEVKALLSSKGLVKAAAPTEDLEVLSNVDKYLESDDISAQDFIDIQGEAIQVGEEEEDEMGLQSFVNDLPGGRAFRRRARRKMIKQNEKLIKDLSSSSSKSNLSSTFIKKSKETINKLKIQQLEDDKKELKIKVVLALSNPFTAILAKPLLKKIEEIDSQIQALKRG